MLPEPNWLVALGVTLLCLIPITYAIYVFQRRLRSTSNSDYHLSTGLTSTVSLVRSFLPRCRIEQDASCDIPEDVIEILKSMRLFGYLDDTFYENVREYSSIIEVAKDDFLFKIGDPVDSLFLLIDGKVRLFCEEGQNTNLVIRDVVSGEGIYSLFSILDVIMGNNDDVFKFVSAQAQQKCRVLRLSLVSFQNYFWQNPPSLVFLVQLLALRINQLMQLYVLLGLHYEIMLPEKEDDSPPVQMTPEFDDMESRYDAAAEDTSSYFQMAKEKSLLLGGPSRKILKETKFSFQDGTINMKTHNDNRNSGLRNMKHVLTDDAMIEDMLKVLLGVFVGCQRDKLAEVFVLSSVEENSVVIDIGDDPDALVVVINGTLIVSHQQEKDDMERHLFNVRRGEMPDILPILTGEPSWVIVKSAEKCRLASITCEEMYNLMAVCPSAVLHLVKTHVQRMTPLVRKIDYAIEWRHVEAGRYLYEQGDPGNAVYYVFHGEFQSVRQSTDNVLQGGHRYGANSVMGLRSAMANETRTGSMGAVRESEVAVLPVQLLHVLCQVRPVVMRHVAKILSSHYVNRVKSAVSSDVLVGGSKQPCRCVAVLCANTEVPVHCFLFELQMALSHYGTSRRISSDVVFREMGDEVMSPHKQFRLSSWLAHQENIHDVVLFQCDLNVNEVTDWTKLCLRSADAILVVGLARSKRTVHTNEHILKQYDSKKTFVLLHKSSTNYPVIGEMKKWLDKRPWCSKHLHIRLPSRCFRFGQDLERVQRMYHTISAVGALPLPRITSDICRLARVLTGRAVGLALGGGGARGCSHVGVIRALVEHGVPIDMLGGTSIGALVGAVYAEEASFSKFAERITSFSSEMTSWLARILDLTYPYTSLFTGRSFNLGIAGVFANRNIEDLWLPYFCISTDISNSEMRVHNCGSTWRYVRASMSLSGYLPPLCDPKDGALLLDGGYANNLPADILMNAGASRVAAVEVSSKFVSTLSPYGHHLSGWYVLWRSLNPWSKFCPPTFSEVECRLAYVSSETARKKLKNIKNLELVSPPVQAFGTLQFESHAQLVQVGYEYMLNYLRSRGGAAYLFCEHEQEDEMEEETENLSSSS